MTRTTILPRNVKRVTTDCGVTMGTDTLRSQLEWIMHAYMSHTDHLEQHWIGLGCGIGGELRVVAFGAVDAAREFEALGARGLTQTVVTGIDFANDCGEFKVEMVGFRNPRVGVSPANPLAQIVAGPGGKGVGGIVFCRFHAPIDCMDHSRRDTTIMNK